MSKTASPKPTTRDVVAIDRPLADELGAMGKQIGISSTAAMVRLALRHVAGRVNRGELINVNGELQPAKTKAA